MVIFEILKPSPKTLDPAASVALNVDSAAFGVGLFSSELPSEAIDCGPQPMYIGNV